MIKLIYCLHRIPGMTREEFQEYWRIHHGPLVVSVRDASNIRRYVQNHTITDPRLHSRNILHGHPEPYDGIAMLWWDDIETFAPNKRTAERDRTQKLLTDDEAKFIDFTRSPVWITEEFPIYKNAGGKSANTPEARAKLIYCVRSLPGIPRETFLTAWKHNQMRLLEDLHKTTSHTRCIVSQPCHDEINESMQAGRQRPAPHDAVAETWLDSIESFFPSNLSPERKTNDRVYYQHEQMIIDIPSSPLFFAKEHVFIDR